MVKKKKMEFINVRKRQSYWVPATPAKLVESMSPLACVERQSKTHLGLMFLADNSGQMGSNMAAASFDGGMNRGLYDWDATLAAAAKKKGEGFNGWSAGLGNAIAIDLNASVCDFEDVSCEASHAQKQEKQSTGFNLNRGIDNWDETLASSMPFTELLNLPDAGPLLFPASENFTTRVAAVEEAIDRFSPVLESQIDSSLQRSNAQTGVTHLFYPASANATTPVAVENSADCFSPVLHSQIDGILQRSNDQTGAALCSESNSKEKQLPDAAPLLSLVSAVAVENAVDRFSSVLHSQTDSCVQKSNDQTGASLCSESNCKENQIPDAVHLLSPTYANVTTPVAVENAADCFSPVLHSQIDSSLQKSSDQTGETLCSESTSKEKQIPEDSSSVFGNLYTIEPSLEKFSIDSGNRRVMLPFVILDSDLNSASDDEQNQEEDKQKDVSCAGNDDAEIRRGEAEDAVLESDLPAMSIPSKKGNAKRKHNNGIDLNEKPRQKPKKKIHRPKVVVDGRLNRTPRPRTPKPVTPKRAKKDPSAKRKYVRKNKQKETATSFQDAAGEAIDLNCEKVEKACKKALNFDLNLETRDNSTCTGIDNESETSSTLESNRGSKQQMLESTVHQENGRAVKHPSPEENTGNSVSLVESGCRKPETNVPLMFPGYQESVRNPNDSINSNHRQLSVANHAEVIILTDSCQIIGQNNPRATNLTGCQYNSLQVYQRVLQVRENHCLSTCRKHGPNFPNKFKKKRLRRRPKGVIPLWCTMAEEHDQIARNGYTKHASYYTHRERSLVPRVTPKKVHNKVDSDIYSDFQTQRLLPKGAESLKYNGHGARRNSKKKSSKTKAKTRATSTKQSFNCILSLCRLGVKIKKKRSNLFIRRHDLASLIAIPMCNQSPPTPLKGANTGVRQEIKTSHGPQSCVNAVTAISKCNKLQPTPVNQTVVNEEQGFDILHGIEASINTIVPGKRKKRILKKQSMTVSSVVDVGSYNIKSDVPPPTTVNQALDGAMQAFIPGPDACMAIVSIKHKKRIAKKQAKMRPSECKDIFLTAKLTDPQEVLQMIDFISERLKCLQISNEDRGNRSLVPYEGKFDPAKKRKVLAKVDLDTETLRVWKFLMEKDGKEGVDSMEDEDKKKWWEEERIVFRGRVSSFITRMHLIQGDRRFSPWKGSVVDSVVGVFLTQNVSDHLSSSAFMSLIAKFPNQSASTRNECYKDRELSNNQELIECYPLMENQTVGSETEMGMNHEVEKRADAVVTPTRRESLLESSCCDEIPGGRHMELKGPEYAEQRSSPDRLDGLNCTCSSICSSNPNNLNCKIRISPSSPKVKCTESFEDFGHIETGNVDHTSQKLGLIEEFGSEHTFQQRVPTQEAGTLNPQVSLGTHCTSSECNSCTDFGIENNPCTCTDQQGWRNMKSQSEIIPVDERKSLLGDMLQSRIIQTQLVDVDSTDKRNPIKDAKHPQEQIHSSGMAANEEKPTSARKKKGADEEKKANPVDWDSLRKLYSRGAKQSSDTKDSVDWEAVKRAELREVAQTIQKRGQHYIIAGRIKDFLDRLVAQHESIDLEWLRHVPPDDVKEYLLSICGLGLKSVECVRLLALQHIAFPVDTNVGRIAVRLGWVPLQPLPEAVPIHLLEVYPMMDTIQKYLWPRLCTMDQRTLYELHYQMITFGKVFCTKRQPNCSACPLRGECRHYASALASARLSLTGPEEKNEVTSMVPVEAIRKANVVVTQPPLLEANLFPESPFQTRDCEPIVEFPASPEPCSRDIPERDIEDLFNEDSDEIPTITLNFEKLPENSQEDGTSKALVALSSEAASIPRPKLKFVSRLRTQHSVYELPDSHPILRDIERREPDDPCPYLLSIWTPGEMAKDPEELCNEQTIRGTLLIPCRTAMKGAFPLNGTYFQVNEVFADHESSHNPINVPTALLWNLPRRTLYCGTSATSINRGLTMDEIQYCFWKGYVCVRGFDRKTGAPRPLAKRLHEMGNKKMGTTDD